jgi:hypothetical protein
MKYVMSWTDAPTFQHDLPFIPLPYTYVPFTSLQQFTSLHFTAFFALFITLLTLSLKLLGLQARVPKSPAGSWFSSWMALFTKEHFPMSFAFCSSFSYHDRLCSGNLSLIAFQARSPVYALFQPRFEPIALEQLHLTEVRPTAQAVRRRLPTPETLVSCRVRLCGICGRQSGTEVGFLGVLWFSC